jgi:hypothetical protein
MKTETSKNKNFSEEKDLMVTQNCSKISHKAAQCKLKQVRKERNEVICTSCKKPVHMKADCFKLMKK